MLSRWPIRDKLLLCIGLLLVLVGTLTASGSYGLYAYRGLLKGLRDRSMELPLATELSQHASELRSILSELRGLHAFPALQQGETPWDGQLLREPFRMHLEAFDEKLGRYRDQLERNTAQSDARFRDDRRERETLAEIEATLARIDEVNHDGAWLLDDVKVDDLVRDVSELQRLAAVLPSHLHRRLHDLAREVRLQYRTAIVLTWVSSLLALVMFVLFVRLFYKWIFQPLRKLIEGSRMVAAGNYHHRIHMDTRDEMSELAEAMNEMTHQFQATRDDLDRQVQERTRQAVRSEQLASVGFLAAGVAHEINNPLASIALCSESLERRLLGILDQDSAEHTVVRNYLQMIQDEAFRCKRITEKLLDFSRMGEAQRQRTDWKELVESVVDMVRHLGRYQSKEIVVTGNGPVLVHVNAQEMKQVALNLLTNALDSLDPGGTVQVAIQRRADRAELTVQDDGCGMTPELLEHIFEPFFTRRRNGQGTGLGLSITHRIVADHKGHIQAFSDGPGQGSKFVVTLPVAETAGGYALRRTAA